MVLLLNVLVGTIVLGGIYSLIALGFVFIFRSTGLINFAHGQILTLAAWIAVSLMLSGFPGTVATVVSCIVVAVILAAAYDLVVRRLESNGLFVAVIATMGIGFFLDGLMPLIFGPGARAMPLLPSGSISLGNGAGVGVRDIVIVIVAVAAYLLVVAADRNLKIGVQMRAAAADQLLAAQMGVRVRIVFWTAWGIAGALAALAGILYSATTIVSSSLTSVGLVGLPAALVGGFDSIEGSLPGALIVALVEVLASTFINSSGSYAVTFVVLMIFLLLRPRGLFGSRAIDRV